MKPGLLERIGSVVPTFTRNMNGDSLIFWCGRIWLKKRVRGAKWERVNPC